MDLLADLNSAREQITVLQGQIETANLNLSNANATIASNGVEIASLTSAQDAAQAEVVSVRGELATANASLSAANGLVAERDQTITTLRAEASTAEQKVVERLGRPGGKPAAKKAGTDTTGEIKTTAEAHAAYNAITDARERGQFYADHKALLFPPKK